MFAKGQCFLSPLLVIFSPIPQTESLFTGLFFSYSLIFSSKQKWMKLFEDAIILTPLSIAQPCATLSQSYKMLVNI